MPFFWKKEKKIIEKIEQYLKQIDECSARFHECMQQLINLNNSEQDRELVDSVHKAESMADDIRRDIEKELYNKALIPESREDVLNLLEAMDTIPNSFEATCFKMCLERIIIPREFKSDFMLLVKNNIESYTLIRKAMKGLFYNKPVLAEIHAIDEKESMVDKIERKLIGKIFASNLDKADKILLRDIVISIGDISDLAQTVSDKLNLAIIKRRI